MIDGCLCVWGGEAGPWWVLGLATCLVLDFEAAVDFEAVVLGEMVLRGMVLSCCARGVAVLADRKVLCLELRRWVSICRFLNWDLEGVVAWGGDPVVLGRWLNKVRLRRPGGELAGLYRD